MDVRCDELPKKIIVIGGGASGIFAARHLHALGIEVTILEKNAKIGGKGDTFTDPHQPNLIAERGATAIAANYSKVLKIIKEKNISTEEFLPIKENTVEIMNVYSQLNFFEKTKFICELTGELWRYNKAVKLYKEAVAKLLPLPIHLDLPFEQYAKIYDLPKLTLLLEPFVPGFGYGALSECPTFSILEYMGYLTLPSILVAQKILGKPILVGIQGGFQKLMEEVAKELKIFTSVNITCVQRNKDGVSIHFIKDNEERMIFGDGLVLAISPLQWPTLNMALSSIETECVEKLTYYRYPIGICRIKDLPAQQIYIPQALKSNYFEHVAYLATRDNRPSPENGRLFTVYINVPPGENRENPITPERVRKIILEDLACHLSIPETNITIEEIKIWEDYFSSLPWDTRLKLEKEQFNNITKTFYTGSYTLGSFENVACVINHAISAIDTRFNKSKSYLERKKEETSGLFQFFVREHAKPPTEQYSNKTNSFV